MLFSFLFVQSQEGQGLEKREPISAKCDDCVSKTTVCLLVVLFSSKHNGRFFMSGSEEGYYCPYYYRYY